MKKFGKILISALGLFTNQQATLLADEPIVQTPPPAPVSGPTPVTASTPPAALVTGKPEEQVLASSLGFNIIGAIVDSNEKNEEKNVVLVKILENSSVKAFKIGYVIKEKYTVIHIKSSNEIVISLQENGKEVIESVFKDGFQDNTVKPPSPMLTSLPTQPPLLDYYKEDGFERQKGDIQMTEAYRDKLIEQDLGAILMQARADPVVENGSIIGFVLDQIEPVSIYSKSGIVDGDIVVSINEVPLNNITSAIKLLHSLKKANKVDVEIRRDGKIMPMTLQVK